MLDQTMIKIIQSFIETELENEIKRDYKIKNLQHNHPPLRFKVDNCEYCNTYGNIFYLDK